MPPKPPNLREIIISKTKSDKTHLYSINNLEAMSEAAYRLQSKAGFKLYMYLAKNQHKYTLPLYSSAFIAWAGVGIDAYRSAFNELVAEGFLVEDPSVKDKYTFFEKSQLPPQGADQLEIEIIKQDPPDPSSDLQPFTF